MHQYTNGLDWIDRLYFQVLAEAVVAYPEYSNDYDLMSNKLVPVFLDIIRVCINHVAYETFWLYILKLLVGLRI
jgi:hypothetical protein